MQINASAVSTPQAPAMEGTSRPRDGSLLVQAGTISLAVRATVRQTAATNEQGRSLTGRRRSEIVDKSIGGHLAQARADDLILFNRELVLAAREACQSSRLQRMQSEIDRVERCLSINRRPRWALAMAQWVAGIGECPLV